MEHRESRVFLFRRHAAPDLSPIRRRFFSVMPDLIRHPVPLTLLFYALTLCALRYALCPQYQGGPDMYRLKPNQPDFQTVDGPTPSRTFRTGETYKEIPEEEAHRFCPTGGETPCAMPYAPCESTGGAQ